MDDLISRQAAIDAIKEFQHGAAKWRDEQEERSDIWHRADSAIASALEIGLRVKKLPSAQPEPITVNIDHELTQEEYEKLRKDMANAPIMLLPAAQPEQRWIPCSERPPEEDFWSGRGRQFSDHVFVTIVNHANDDEHFTDTAQTVDGIWQLSNDVDGDCRLPNWCEVIAWMPLPKPYKGEES